jgi:hypothetical protein
MDVVPAFRAAEGDGFHNVIAGWTRRGGNGARHSGEDESD